jgi:putative hemolysin
MDFIPLCYSRLTNPRKVNVVNAMNPGKPMPRITYVQPDDPWLRVKLVDTLERMTGRERVQRIYQTLKQEPFDLQRFFSRGLELAGISYPRDAAAEAAIPREGPLVFIANHPFGVVDGMMLCDIAARTRGNFRILIHARLCQDEDLNPFFLPVEFADTPEARRINIATKREAIRTLKDGGTILIFPAGGISTIGKAGFGTFADLPWSTFAAKLIHKSEAAVVPVFFHGRNSRLFHMASGISMTLRAALLLHEASNKLGQHFDLAIGAPVPYPEMAHLDRQALTAWLHALTWRLALPAQNQPAAG